MPQVRQLAGPLESLKLKTHYELQWRLVLRGKSERRHSRNGRDGN
jgi:hypothetical protein